MNDAAFDWLYPERIQLLSRRHWTPLSVAKKAARFLADAPGRKILDIGSGVGKFCLVGARFFPEAHFCGVEQRRELYYYALAAKEATRTGNVDFINANFTQIDLSEYDGFYFYNAFFENLDDNDRIDQQIEYSSSLYVYYSRYLFKALDSKPSGTRLVTFHSMENEVPPSYQVVDASIDLLLKMWVKR
ncbi:class I SAM-dependent methyltransferase [Chitinophaga japonensis]|uniref:tRNA (guanine(46)-N(7))-methyltransferase n=1 Tax=Chitinophaga japonensis TaxID=104662 RepID=A0A562SYT2_CHIJA|nr:class I SAM-dependent methyltransferase [Chitinophaga japonensis]TWI86451.1 putative methyltransferase [Chitinophaga japonensis]